MMRLGISTACLYPMVTEEALDRLLERGFRLFEIFFNTVSELEPGYVEGLRRRLDKAGAEVVSIHPFTSAFEVMLLFSDYSRRTEDGLAFYRRYFETAQRLGAKFLVLHGQRNYQKGRITEEEYLERYWRLYRLGQEYGITVAQENVVQFRSERAAFIQRMREALGEECAFVLDLKQAVRAGEDPMEMCRAMGERLCHLHFNDHLPGQDCLLPGKGGFSYETLFQYLQEIGYPGKGVIEVYRGNFEKEEELWESLCYLRQIRQKFDKLAFLP